MKPRLSTCEAKMDLFYIILVLFLLVVLGIFFYLLYSGFFYTYSIRCAIPASLPNRFAYTIYTGPYHKIGSTCQRISLVAPRSTIFVVYYDEPEKVRGGVRGVVIGVGQKLNLKIISHVHFSLLFQQIVQLKGICWILPELATLLLQICNH